MNRGVPICVLLAAATAVAWAFADRLEDALYIPPDDPAIQYNKEPAGDPVGKLAKKIESGQLKLDYEAGGWGYLPALLKQLNVPVDSQVLVFSKRAAFRPIIFLRARRAQFISTTKWPSVMCRAAMRWR